MDQFQMADFANYTANVPTKSKVNFSGDKGSKNDQEFTVDAPKFNDLLIEKGEQTGLTKEQEQLLSVAASGMQILGGLGFLQAPEQVEQMETPMIALEGMANDAVNVQMVKVVQSKIQKPQEPKDLEIGVQKEPQQLGETELLPKGETVQEEGEGFQEVGKEHIVEKQQPKETLHMSKPVEKDELPNVQTREVFPEYQEKVNMPEPTVVSKSESHTPIFHETMKVNSKEEIPQNLAKKIVEQSTKGIREFEIQIEPKNLGKMAVKLEYKNGEALISIVCSEPKTLELVKNHVNDIRTVVQRNLQEDMMVFVDEKKAETFAQQERGNSDAGRESEWERQKEKRKREAQAGNHRFLQELRLGLHV